MSNLYNNRHHLNNIGKKMVNYIEVNTPSDYIIFKQNYPNAYESYIKTRRQKPNTSTFVYIPM